MLSLCQEISVASIKVIKKCFIFQRLASSCV